MGLRFSLNFNPAGWAPTEYRQVLAHAQVAEEAGFDEISISEHVVQARTRRPEEALHQLQRPDGSFSPWFEPLTTLAAIGAVTERVRLNTAILIAPLRPAALLAKMAANVDLLTNGRLSLSVGASWHREEYEALGVSFEDRGQVLDDTIGACQALWSQHPASFHSSTVVLDEVSLDPLPIQPGGPPILFAGKFTPRNVRRIVTMGSGWLPNSPTADDYATEYGAIRQAVADAGRDPDELYLLRNLNPLDADGNPIALGGPPGNLARSLERLPRWEAAGTTVVGVGARGFTRGPDELDDFLRAFGKEVEQYR